MLCTIKKNPTFLSLMCFKSSLSGVKYFCSAMNLSNLCYFWHIFLPAFFGSLSFHISPVLCSTEKWLMISVRPFRFSTHCQIHLSRLLVVVSTNYSFLQTYSIFFFYVEHIFCISSMPYENTLETPYSDPEFSPLNFNRFYNHWENLNSKFQGT